jgi:hypothetical protein
MLTPSIDRSWSGVYLTGQQISIDLSPTHSGRLTVNVIAMPVLTGFDGPCRLGDTEATRLEFTPDEIVVRPTELACLTADQHAPMVRHGFVLTLEPGMAPLLEKWMPQLATVARVSKDIAEYIESAIADPERYRTWSHLSECITEVAARVVLDRFPVDQAIAAERRWRKEHNYSDVFIVLDRFDDERVLSLLGSVSDVCVLD